MNQSRNKRKLRLHLAFVYTLMVVAVISIVAVLVLVIQGYRYNRYDGKVEQGGLVQFGSRPTGAAVTVDGVALANKTASKITLTAGSHEIAITHSGYTNWKKTVIVKPGGVLWLNYAQLFPITPKIATVATFTNNVTSALPSPDQKIMAVVPVAADPDIDLISLNADTPTTTKLTIPSADYTVVDGATQTFSIVNWDKDSNLLLIKHTYGDKLEYLSFDTRNSSAIDVTTALGVDALKIFYSLNDSNVVYILTPAHELRRGSLSGTTLSGPLATNVSDMSMTEQNDVSYTTLADDKGVRQVGYVSTNSNRAKVIASYTSLPGPLAVATGNYYGDHYVAIIHGATLEVLRGNFPSSDTTGPLSLADVTEQLMTNGADTVGFSPSDNRIVYAVHGADALTYDLELSNASRVTLSGALPDAISSQASTTPGVQWFDSYHLMTTGGPLYVYDFDGTNGIAVASASAALPAVLANGAKYFYYFTADGTSTKLKQYMLVPN